MTSLLFLGEGTSDAALVVHCERLAVAVGLEATFSAPELSRIRPPVGSAVKDKLVAAKKLGGEYAGVFAHRDADSAGPDARRAEVLDAAREVFPSAVHVAIVPVRATEAWLLLDEQQLRTVAGNPSGRTRLELPKARQVESVADPKSLLRELLAAASQSKGRRL